MGTWGCAAIVSSTSGEEVMPPWILYAVYRGKCISDASDALAAGFSADEVKDFLLRCNIDPDSVDLFWTEERIVKEREKQRVAREKQLVSEAAFYEHCEQIKRGRQIMDEAEERGCTVVDNTIAHGERTNA